MLLPGSKCVSFSENPETLGFDSLYSDKWEPFFAACEETGTVINLHVGSSGTISRPSVDSPTDAITVLFPVNGMVAFTDWLYSRIPLRYPALRIVLSEAGVGWVPFMLDRFRRVHLRRGGTGKGLSLWRRDDPEPDEVIRNSFRFTSIDDRNVWRSLDLVGEDNVIVESDYPHEDSSWPDTQQTLRAELGPLGAAVERKVCYENACDLYRVPYPPKELLRRSEIDGGTGFT